MSNIHLPTGFNASAVKSGLKNNSYDLALITSNSPCDVVALYTKNKLRAAPLLFSKKNDKNKISALIVNSKCANSATGKNGYKSVVTIAEKVAKTIGCKKENILAASTGIIGVTLEVDKILNSIEELKNTLIPYSGNIANAILTTDKYEKVLNETINVDGVDVSISVIAKGSSIVHPNMGTVLLFMLTDLNVDKKVMKKIFTNAIKSSLNKISIDGEMSTNDCAFMLANGEAQNKKIVETDKKNIKLLENTINEMCLKIAKLIVIDGEGSTKIISVDVINAKTQKQATDVAQAISLSNRIKISFGANKFNVGAILSSIGKVSDIEIEKLKIYINNIVIFENSESIENIDYYSINLSLHRKEQNVIIDLGYKEGFHDIYYFSDLTSEYIIINTSYHI